MLVIPLTCLLVTIEGVIAYSYSNSGFVIPLSYVYGIFNNKQSLHSLCQGGGHVALPRVFCSSGVLGIALCNA